MARRRARAGGGRQVEVTIDELGGQGDGIARWQGRPLFVPLTLPGDRLRVRLTGERAGAWVGEAVELIAEGPGRVAPPCPHFGPCGGCSLQHLEAARYRAWKRDQVTRALTRRGLEAERIDELVMVPPGCRRRVSLAAECQARGRIALGFHRRRGRKVVDLGTCLLLRPALLALFAPLRAVLADVLAEGGRAEIAVSDLEGGADLLLATAEAPDLAARERLAAFAESCDLARLSWRPLGAAAESPEPLIVRRQPQVRFGEVAVAPPPGAFLQPSAEGEAALTAAVLAGLSEVRGAIADLYAGLGTFTFPLADKGRVRAFESEAAAVAAIRRAAGRSGLGGRVGAEQRDLARAPLEAAELDAFDALVFDPPRAGAKTQVQAIAASRLARVIAVSCNPSTFARDARILVDGGFRLGAITPVDQFPWSGHLELVASFTRS